MCWVRTAVQLRVSQNDVERDVPDAVASRTCGFCRDEHNTADIGPKSGTCRNITETFENAENGMARRTTSFSVTRSIVTA